MDGDFLEHYRARLCDGALAGIEFDIDEMQFLAIDFEVDDVGVALAPLLAAGRGTDPDCDIFSWPPVKNGSLRSRVLTLKRRQMECALQLY